MQITARARDMTKTTPKYVPDQGAAMDDHITDANVRLTYFTDKLAIEALDQDRITEELTNLSPGENPAGWLGRRLLTDYDHLVLASNRHTGASIGLLGARHGTTSSETFLLLETAFIASSARGRKVIRRMIALAMLRIAGLAETPQVIAARTSNPLGYRMLRSFGQNFRKAVFFPEPVSNVIPLSTAALARRIAREICPRLRFNPLNGALRGGLAEDGPALTRGSTALALDPEILTMFDHSLERTDQMLTVLDLRPEAEADIVDTTRRLFRGR